ncbi:Uncharacterised protein [Mycobacteroides abscessus subsp. abscessus]|nr:Uncharacterised protein [Mycobacteroides abscessus subsp. abscessus]
MQMADAEMSPSPAARPSSPSMKLTALMVATVITTVSNPDWKGSRTMVPMFPNGTGTCSQLTPITTMTPAAVSCPTNFVNASRPHRSSMIPTMTMTAPAVTTAPMSLV